jgi:hypothetical protein
MFVGGAALAALAGCVETTSPGPGVPSAGEQACLRAVTQASGDPDVILRFTNPYQGGGTLSTIEAPSTGAQYSCVAGADGSVLEVQSL